ncbi:TetR/AcrR family transcriptional regulator [Mycobacterium sp. RTGN3]|nr:TetR family transcriptional regulator [Mycobacterium sp. RTGN3]
MADQPTEQAGTTQSRRQPDTADPPSVGSARPRRRRCARRTREEILAAAARRFASGGYATVTLKEIAADAGVTAALVVRYFGSKVELFRAVLRESSPSRVGDDVLAGPTETLGLRLAKFQVETWLTPELVAAPIAALRSLDVGDARSVLSTEIDRRFTEPLTAVLSGPNPQVRAKVMVSQMIAIGLFAFGLLLDPDGPKPSAEEIDEITRMFGAALQASITA